MNLGYIKLQKLTQSNQHRVIIRAKTPSDFDANIHKVTKFKRVNYDGYYIPCKDGEYRYNEPSAESSVSYTEHALLSMSNIEVISFCNN